ncbi:MAG TPA: SPOR domain-containing protein [Accumulibacter sp.]|nr:SPOR domain-containing protein [Accumulibacter sp.]
MSRDMKPRKTPPAKKSSGGTLIGLFIGLVIGMLAVAGVVWYVNKAPLPFTTNGQQPKPAAPAAAATGKPPAAQETPPMAAASQPLSLPGKPGEPGGDKQRFDFYKILPGKAEAIPDPKPEEPKPEVAKPAEVKPPISKPSESKPVDSKPTESMSAESKPADSKPTKSAASKAAESKTSKTSEGKAGESKTADSKPAESRSKPEKDNTLKEPIYLQAGSFQNASEADNQKARLALLGAEARIQQVMLQDKVWYRVRIGPYHKMDEVTHMRSDLAKQGIDANVVRKD